MIFARYQDGRRSMRMFTEFTGAKEE